MSAERVTFVDRMGLRLRLNLLVGAVMALLVFTLAAREFESTRHGVAEEVIAANRVATQLLRQVLQVTAQEGLPEVLRLLQRLGRVRANELTLLDESGRPLYRSPPSAYKEGRSAPGWFVAMLAPELASQSIDLPGARLLVRADPSRAILDGWDEMVALAALGGAGVVLVSVVLFWRLGRVLAPFDLIVSGIERLEAGDLAARLPALPGREAGAIGSAVNRMAARFTQHLQESVRAAQTSRELGESRERTRLIEEHMEAERREIARELHDELGQSVTAIGSLAQSLQRRLAAADPQASQTASLIAAEAARLYDAMHGIIPRLAPLTLDSLGLTDALSDLVAQVRERHPELTISLNLDAPGAPPGPSAALALYRCAQEGLANAIRHAGASRIDVTLLGDADRIVLRVRDNGRGLPEDWRRPGHFGLRGMSERLQSLQGDLRLESQDGLILTAEIPLRPRGTP